MANGKPTLPNVSADLFVTVTADNDILFVEQTKWHCSTDTTVALEILCLLRIICNG